MRNHLIILSTFIALAGGAAAQSIHPPTREGFGAKPDSAESQRERIPEPPGANRPEAQGGANSQQNREYGKETQPRKKGLEEGLPRGAAP